MSGHPHITIGPRTWYRCARCHQLVVNVEWIDGHPYGPTCAEIIKFGSVVRAPRIPSRRSSPTPVHW